MFVGKRCCAPLLRPRADGTTGNTFEAIFATDPTDTVFRGDKGLSQWVKDAALPTAKGFGAMADLAVAATNDPALQSIVASAAAAMTAPSLKDIRAAATPVFGAWAETLDLTRELTPVLVRSEAAGNGTITTLVDHAVYVEDAGGARFVRASDGAMLVDYRRKHPIDPAVAAI